MPSWCCIAACAKFARKGADPPFWCGCRSRTLPRRQPCAALQEEYALRSDLDPAYVVRSVSMVQAHGRPMVILEDPLGTPLDLLLNGAMDIAQFLRLAIRVAAALGHVHSRGSRAQGHQAVQHPGECCPYPRLADGPGFASRCRASASRASSRSSWSARWPTWPPSRLGA